LIVFVLRSAKAQWFICAIVTILFFAWSCPSLPEGGYQSHIKFFLVAGIFLCSGLCIRSRELGVSLRHYRLHLFVQGVSLMVTVLMCWALDSLWQVIGLDPSLRLGLLVLGALPTTVTSCVALTAAARGNQSGALVNACLGNLLGIVVTPLWLMLTVGSTGGELDILPVFKKLSLFVLLPVLMGQVVQFTLRGRISPEFRKRLAKLGQVLLLGIMYLSFQKAFASGGSISWQAFLHALLICLGLHALWLFISWYGAGLSFWHMSPADRRCALICGSQKTLALGLPLIMVCFAANPGLPLISLPILIYHPLQMLVAGFLVPKLASSMSETT
jgi:solute carrier family 10 (sodium/bile acid cotransporter), member 7